MKIKHIILVALTALALSLASIGVIGPAIAGGLSGGVVAGSKPGIASGANGATAGSKLGIAGGGGATVAGSKPGVAAGSGADTAHGEVRRAVPRITIDGSNAIRYGQETN